MAHSDSIGSRLWSEIFLAVREFRQNNRRPCQTDGKTGKRVRQTLEDCFSEALLPHLIDRFPAVAREVLAVVGLVGYLAPDNSKIETSLPTDQCEELLRIVREQGASHSDKLLVQIVLAYGAKWRRQAKTGEAQWDGVWAGARQELTDISSNFVMQAITVLHETVRGFRRNWDHDRNYALMIVELFIEVRARPNSPAYAKFNTIHSLDLSRGNLYGLLQRAIQGRGPNWVNLGSHLQQRFLPNWFRNGLLYPLLKQDERLKVDRVAFQTCRHCDHSAEYEGGMCPNGHGPTLIFPKQLLVACSEYRGRKFWHCNNHIHNWEDTPTCPDCDQPRPESPRWGCVCGKQHNWQRVLRCPTTRTPRPSPIHWSCPNHYYSLHRCPACKRERNNRPSTLMVRRAYAQELEVLPARRRRRYSTYD